ncbi:MAG: prepilin-type N-terminal cleavage/methylation domain-containing protein [Acidiferrobacterales bacterium]|nr:prepilin-type N-terminal cleavage/methylation domain-containing protein [Acidiferrobacterales bacterium]
MKHQTSLLGECSRVAKSRENQRGYLLIETMVAIVIAAVGIIGLGTAMNHTTRVGINASQLTTLSIAQRSLVGELRLFSRADDLVVRNFEFHSDSPPTASHSETLSRKLQHQVDLISPSFTELHSAVICDGDTAIQCEICFRWFDTTGRFEQDDTSNHTVGATNRSLCQTQVV